MNNRRAPLSLSLYYFGLIAFLYLPIVVLFLFSINSNTTLYFPLKGVTLDWYQKLFQADAVLRAARNSLIVASGSSFAATLLGTMVSILMMRYQFRGKTLLLGLAALPFELPISTTILLRSIAEIAREEGEDLSAPEAAFACVEVFALGGQGGGESAFESGYFTVRAALAKSVSDSARFVAAQGVAALPAPVVARLVSQIAARFGIVVSEKVAAQAAPILGAIGGAAVNAAFADHFQTLARGHFIVRRLERQHGASVVAFEYQRLQGERVREYAEGRRAAS